MIRVANTILMVITLALAVFIVVTKKFVWIPFFIILLGASLLPKSIKAIKNPENKDDEFGAYLQHESQIRKVGIEYAQLQLFNLLKYTWLKWQDELFNFSSSPQLPKIASIPTF